MGVTRDVDQTKAAQCAPTHLTSSIDFMTRMHRPRSNENSVYVRFAARVQDPDVEANSEGGAARVATDMRLSMLLTFDLIR